VSVTSGGTPPHDVGRALIPERPGPGTSDPSAGDHGPRRLFARRSVRDRWYRASVTAVAVASFVLLFLIGFFLFWESRHAIDAEGWKTFLTTTSWRTSGRHISFGIVAALYWTVVIAVIALIVGVPVSLCVALFITDYAPIRLRRGLIALVDLLAVVPSIIFGLWGLFLLSPNLEGFARFLSVHLGWFPLFRNQQGNTLFSSSAFIAGILVGVMIVPIVTSVSREIFSLTPVGEREGAMALGATKASVIRTVVLPFGRGGFIGAIMLGLGRAMGETIAVAIIVSPSYIVSSHILTPGANSIAALIARQFDQSGKIGNEALLAAGFVLFVFTLIVNFGASIVVNRSRTGASA
jgi:phosphate transport system permease protein